MIITRLLGEDKTCSGASWCLAAKGACEMSGQRSKIVLTKKMDLIMGWEAK